MTFLHTAVSLPPRAFSSARGRWLLAAWAAAVLAACAREPAEPAAEALCPAGLYEDAAGCHGRYCAASCAAADQCQELEGCQPSGMCGACASDDECRAGRACRQGFCLPRALPVFDLEVAAADYKRLVADPYATLFVPCGLNANGVRYAGCQVRISGASSRDYPKRSFRIEFPEGARNPGYSRKLTLRAEYNDPSFLRNYLAHDIFRRFSEIPVPRTRFVRLLLNGEPYGLMLEVERVGGKFLEVNGRVRDASMYEAEPNAEGVRQGLGSLVPLPRPELYLEGYSKKAGAEDDHSELRTLIEAVIGPDYEESLSFGPGRTRRLREAFAIEGLLDYLAVMAMVQNQDHVRKNYNISRQPRGAGGARWEIYPQDLDLTFGCLFDDKAGNSLCNRVVTDAPEKVGAAGRETPIVFPVDGHFNRLIDLALTSPELEPGFRCRVCAMADSPYWNQRLPELITALSSAIAEAAVWDPQDRNGTVADLERAVEQLRTFIPGRAAVLRARLGCGR